MQEEEKILGILRNCSIISCFQEFPDESPIGSQVDIVITYARVVLVRSARSMTESNLDKTLTIGAGVVTGMYGMLTVGALLDKYKSVSQDRKLRPEFLNPLLQNGLAVEASAKDIRCEVYQPKKSWLDMHMFSWAEQDCWVAFFGQFRFQQTSLHGFLAFKHYSQRKVKKYIEDRLPVDVILVEERKPIEKLFESWEERILGPGSREARLKRRGGK